MAVTTISEQEIQQMRADTKGTMHRIHFNNAGASLPTDAVVKTVTDYLEEEAEYGGYETESKYQQRLDNTYVSIARLINANKNEIALVENASTAWAIAFNGIRFNKGDEILTCEMEYVSSILGFLHAQKTHGIIIKVIPNDEHGNFSLPALEAAISPRTRLVAMTHIPSSTGGMIPVVEIGKIARTNNILYLLDACQSVGQLPVDVKEINCDMLCATGRKYLRGPRGTGFLFVRKEVQDTLDVLFIDGSSTQWMSVDDYKLRDDAKRFELFERNRALTLGLGKAVDYALNIGIDRIWERIQYLADSMRDQLKSIEGVSVHDIGDQQSGIVTFSVNGFESATIKSMLGEKRINVSIGLAKSTLYYMNKNNLESVVRASVHYYNTEEEIRMLCDELMRL